MKHINIINKFRLALTTVLLSILICFTTLSLVACAPKNINPDEAIEIAKKDFGCDKVLWFCPDALPLWSDAETETRKLQSKYAFYVIGEKAGKEVYIVVPSTTLDKPFIAAWNFNYAFLQIAEKFIENGANCLTEINDELIKISPKCIKFETSKGQIEYYAEFFDVGCDGETFYNRLDVNGVFRYGWDEWDGSVRFPYLGMVAQENGELKFYKKYKKPNYSI